jgi:dTDP-4-dehydrorhamnose reductase
MSSVSRAKILVTGGSGLLGHELQKLIPEALFPPRDEFDVTNPEQIERYVIGKDIELILHAAAFTSPPKVDEDPVRGIDVNIIGTAHLVKLCCREKIKLVYLCTDYVFKGDKGSYKEDDPVYPVNKYAWSKLGGECAVRMHDPHLIIRASFGPNEFPYPKAFVDQWTSRLPVAEFAHKLVKAIDSGINGVLHIGGDRQTVYEYAKGISPEKEIGGLSINDVAFTPPVDTSLDTARYKEVIEQTAKGTGGKQRP